MTSDKRYTQGQTEVLFEALATGDVSRAIMNQEKRGQSEVVNTSILPREVYTYQDSRTTEEQYAAMGVKVVGEYDDLFYRVELPTGWKKESTSHDMHSSVLDERGRKRIGVFYKAAFYDRRARASINSRYSYHQIFDETIKKYLPIVAITDGGMEIHRIEFTMINEWDSGSEFAEAWLNERYPEYRNPFAYWD